MNTKRHLVTGLLLLFPLGLLSGCLSLARDAAEKPYREALRDGRMSPTDYMRKKEEIRRASEPSNEP